MCESADWHSGWEQRVNVTLRVAAVTGGMLATLLAAGCGAQATPPHHVTAVGCTRYMAYAIEHDFTVTRDPAACQGLSTAQLN